MNIKVKREDSRIVLPYGAGRRIARVMGVTNETVSRALSGTKRTKTAERIRYRAVNDFGGKEI